MSIYAQSDKRPLPEIIAERAGFPLSYHEKKDAVMRFRIGLKVFPKKRIAALRE
jgi:hypothetical protein